MINIHVVLNEWIFAVGGPGANAFIGFLRMPSLSCNQSGQPARTDTEIIHTFYCADRDTKRIDELIEIGPIQHSNPQNNLL